MSKENKTISPGFAGWEKWAIMTVIIIGLASVVIYFNLRVFGIEDGAPYIAVVLFIVLVSLLVTRHVKRVPVTANFIKAAFIFEILLTVALGVNAAYSLSTMREMSIAGEAEKLQSENLKAVGQTIDAAGKLQSKAAQRAAMRALEAQTKAPSPESPAAAPVTRAAVFSQKERILFWIMISELAIAMLATFALLGLTVFDKDLSGIPDFLEKQPAKQEAPPAPSPAPPAPVYGEGKPRLVWRGSNIRPQ